MNLESVGNRPGSELPESLAYQPRLEGEKEVGFTDPEGQFHSLEDGEGLVQIKPDADASEREVYIKDKYGKLTPINIWIEQQNDGRR